MVTMPPLTRRGEMGEPAHSWGFDIRSLGSITSVLNFFFWLGFRLGSASFFLGRFLSPRLRGCFAGYVNNCLVVDSLINFLGEGLIGGGIADPYATVGPRSSTYWLTVMNSDTPVIYDFVPAHSTYQAILSPCEFLVSLFPLDAILKSPIGVQCSSVCVLRGHQWFQDFPCRLQSRGPRYCRRCSEPSSAETIGPHQCS